mgnify:CR=1 FL=1|tara:strand:- start:1148 stop:1954 length:807 start_codon:yes stop_codon:yes gene_type:complete
MKYNHNKKRNTALIYEMLVREITRAMMNENQNKKIKISRLFKKYFHKNSVLGREYAIYKSLNESRELEANTFSQVLAEAKRQYLNINKKKVFDTQTKLISEINKSIGREFWTNFVGDYQWSATIQQTIAQENPPKKQVLLEKKIMEIYSLDNNKGSFPKVNKLTINTFVNKFNSTYKDKLTESQRSLINKFILSPSDDGLEFRSSLYEEIDIVKGQLLAVQKKVENKHLVERIDHVVSRLESFKKQKATKGVLTNVLQIQNLVRELKS